MEPWKVVPVCAYQKLDVRPEDLVANGAMRTCMTYRGGGGYDQFPHIWLRRHKYWGPGENLGLQLVVQLYGCNLDCPYCYVTRSGVWGNWLPFTSTDLRTEFVKSGAGVFHLMGGAPAIYLDQWPDLIAHLPGYAIFHSDFLLTEREYKDDTLKELSQDHAGRGLYAVDIKGVTPEDYLRNTRKEFKEDLFWSNFEKLVKHEVPTYITFTNPDMNHYDKFRETLMRRLGSGVLDDAYIIPLINYDAQPFVDIRPWPRRRRHAFLRWRRPLR